MNSWDPTTMPDPQPTILLVDDDQDLRNLLERVLLRSGMAVHPAGDGRQAIKLLARQKFDLVVTDIIMPDVEGIELILKIRKEHPGLPIIAMSAGGRLKADGYLKMAQTFGANQVLEKPFPIDVFVGEVRRLALSAGAAPADPSPAGA
jgi:DNA-binding NtrC family response regulator